MNINNNNYIIYKAQNKKNGMAYIGATTYSVKQRKLDHIERAIRGENNKFHEAICTYGAEAFLWKEIDATNSIDELAQKEKQYILKYKSKEDGYNSDSGGGIKKSVYQYNIEDGSLINTFNSLDEAANVVDGIKQQISRACLNVNNVFKGYFWSYEFKEPFTPPKDKRRKQVIQFSLDVVKVAEFDSVADASRSTGVSKSCIAKVCRGEREIGGGFLWEYI